MTETNLHDPDQYSGPDPFLGDNTLYNAFLNDDIIKLNDDITNALDQVNEFTIEGRPTLKPDKEFEENMSKAYDEQRKNRLADCIDDYLNDDDKTAIDLYNDMLASLEETRDYHERQKTKIESVIRMMRPTIEID